MRTVWDKEHIVKLQSCTVIAWSARLKETELWDCAAFSVYLAQSKPPVPEKLAGFLPFDSEKAAFQLGKTPSPTENKIKSIAHKNSLYFSQCLSSVELKGR